MDRKHDKYCECSECRYGEVLTSVGNHVSALNLVGHTDPEVVNALVAISVCATLRHAGYENKEAVRDNIHDLVDFHCDRFFRELSGRPD